jgi:hypothetical protein
LSAAAGIFLVLLGVYWLTAPGRIDMVDGQVRYEVARVWLLTGHPAVRDPALVSLQGLVYGTDRAVYAVYNATGSVLPMPLMLASRLWPAHSAETDRFAFSLIGPLFGALLGGILLFAYTALGVSLKSAITWSFVVALGTLWWPASVTVFDQNQHAVFLLLAVLLSWESGRRECLWLAALGGAAAGVLLSYQENYALLVPMLALGVFASPREGVDQLVLARLGRLDRPAALRYVTFGICSLTGLVAIVAFNYERFGRLVPEGRYDDPIHFLSGNPIAAALSLALSPGRSVFLFSPPLLLCIFGMVKLFRKAPLLVFSLAGTTIVHFLFIIQLSFFGGDWCWGPRYLLVLVPLLGLTFPFTKSVIKRPIVITICALGVVTQLLAVSLDHHRFYFERNLTPHFWSSDPWFHFKHSQLVARVAEVADTARNGAPVEAVHFSPTPRRELTYSPFGPANPRLSSRWMQHFSLFYELRPWPAWVFLLDPAVRPFPPLAFLVGCLVSLALGASLLYIGLHRDTDPGARSYRTERSVPT